MLLVLGLSLPVAAGQQGEPVAAQSPAMGRDNPAPQSAGGAATPANLKIFFTGYLLGYYRLPQWQNDDFEDNVRKKDGQIE